METMVLLGAEDVRNASVRMENAANSMAQTASQIESAFFQHQRFLVQWLEDFRAVLEGHKG